MKPSASVSPLVFLVTVAAPAWLAGGLAAAQAPPIDPHAPIHLGFTLRLTHPAELQALLAAQQDPASPDFRRWLTPAEFGARFGQPAAVVERVRGWLSQQGFDVLVYPNQSFVEAFGTVAQARDLLRVDLRRLASAPPSVHVPVRAPIFPAWLKDLIIHVGGIDTRPHARHHLNQFPGLGLYFVGPQDERALYGEAPILNAGFYGQGQKLVFIGAAEAPGGGANVQAIEWYFHDVSDATATYAENVLPNPDADYAGGLGANVEDELDAEMLSVGAPGALSITHEVVPASQLFVLGAQDVANNFADATVVSWSWGNCEPAELAIDAQQGNDELAATRQAIQQGTAEGQSWFVATGDSGADGCRDGSGPSADFPADVPEVIAVGGTSLPEIDGGPPAPGQPQFPDYGFDTDGALPGYVQEVAWAAGGGGVSAVFSTPGYQAAVGVDLDGGRGLPDLALLGGSPTTQMDVPAVFSNVEGTSISAPLAAGFFATLAGALGCRLGDLHSVLYQLGEAQRAGTIPPVFHDVVAGNNAADGVAGYAAGPGYDLATGWGSIDVGALLAALPACPGGAVGTAGPAYSQCAFAGCADAGCTTVPEGPSACDLQLCAPPGTCSAATCCPEGDFCRPNGGPFGGAADGGFCGPGCYADRDCADGGVCDVCGGNVCGPAGNPAAVIGSPCNSNLDCSSGDTCLLWTGIYGDAGYCSRRCSLAPRQPGSPIDGCDFCPTGSACEPLVLGPHTVTAYCYAASPCAGDGGTCPQPGDVCQPALPFPPTCAPACAIQDAGPDAGLRDTCANLVGPGWACNAASGVCEQTPCTLTSEADGGLEDSCTETVLFGGFACEPDAGRCEPVPCSVSPAQDNCSAFGGLRCNQDAGVCCDADGGSCGSIRCVVGPGQDSCGRIDGDFQCNQDAGICEAINCDADSGVCTVYSPLSTAQPTGAATSANGSAGTSSGASAGTSAGTSAGGSTSSGGGGHTSAGGTAGTGGRSASSGGAVTTGSSGSTSAGAGSKVGSPSGCGCGGGRAAPDPFALAVVALLWASHRRRRRVSGAGPGLNDDKTGRAVHRCSG